MSIRKAKRNDAKNISVLICDTINVINRRDYNSEQIKSWQKAGTPKKIKNYLSDKKTYTCVAIINNKVIGVGAIKEDEITALYVKARYTGKGIGTKILKHLEKRAINKGIKKIKVNSSLTAYNFYKKNGYKKFLETTDEIKIEEIPCLAMVKEIPCNINEVSKVYTVEI